jgi:hypothetical protein
MFIVVVRETKGIEATMQLGVPCSWGLPKSVERFLQLQHLLLLADREPWQLLDEDQLVEVPIEEGGFHVHVMDPPPLMRHHR